MITTTIYELTAILRPVINEQGQRDAHPKTHWHKKHRDTNKAFRCSWPISSRRRTKLRIGFQRRTDASSPLSCNGADFSPPPPLLCNVAANAVRNRTKSISNTITFPAMLSILCSRKIPSTAVSLAKQEIPFTPSLRVRRLGNKIRSTVRSRYTILWYGIVP